MDKCVVYDSIESGNQALVTIAIGNDFFDNWRTRAFPSWNTYAKKHKLKIIVITDDLIEKSHPDWKKPQWQKMLIADHIQNFHPGLNEICYLDTDIIINHFAPSIFNEIKDGKVGSVSLRKNLPFDREYVYKKLAVLRRNYFDLEYPLDSALLISLEKLYFYHNLAPQKDEFCTGVLLFKINQFSQLMKEWFSLYSKEVKSITNGGEQTHLNYHILSQNLFHRLDYKWQAIWSYEAAWKYPFLFKSKMTNFELIEECAKSSLSDNYFLHFASRWNESEVWKYINLDFNETEAKILTDFFNFLEYKHTGDPKGYLQAKLNE